MNEKVSGTFCFVIDGVAGGGHTPAGGGDYLCA
jgi:hypothetical protein